MSLFLVVWLRFELINKEFEHRPTFNRMGFATQNDYKTLGFFRAVLLGFFGFYPHKLHNNKVLY